MPEKVHVNEVRPPPPITAELLEAARPAASIHSDTELLNWLEANPRENLQAVEWQLDNGKARTIRESITYHLQRDL